MIGYLVLRRDGNKANYSTIPIKILYVPYKQGIRNYYLPEIAIKNGAIVANFYRKQGHTTVKYTKQQIKDSWKIKNQARAREFERILKYHDWTKAKLARHLGVSRAWVTIVLNELKK